MGLDITKLKEESILEQLGEGDWLIALPNNYPDLLVSRAARDELEHGIGSRFVHWVMDGVDIEINHDFDPPWDSSGLARRHQADSLMLLVRYERFEDWLENAYTGKSKASYVSGMGIFWETYGEELDYLAECLSYELLKTHVKPLQSHLNEEEDYWDEGYEEVDMVDICLRFALESWIKRLSTKDVWDKYEPLVRARLAQEAEEDTKIKLFQQKSKEFCEQHLSDIKNERIEMPDFRKKALEKRIRELFADADPELLEGIAEFALPLNISKSVKHFIQLLAKEALTG
jgi:hypothetical protein